jgi:hypothetical protein
MKKKFSKKPITKSSISAKLPDSQILFKCTACTFEEYIPKDVVDFFDLTDGGDPLVPPRFNCQKCSGFMEPVYYVNHDGIVYKQ